MSKEYSHAVFIGRFQPFHNQHEKVVRQGLRIADELVLVIGSTDAARSIKNPWIFKERREAIRKCFSSEDNKRLHIVAVEDHYYAKSAWIAEVQSKVGSIIGHYEEKVCLLGHFKDQSSDYLKSFPSWDFVPAETDSVIHATDIRTDLFTREDVGMVNGWEDKKIAWNSQIPQPVAKWILDWVEKNRVIYDYLKDEFKAIQDYKAQWNDAPFPPVFVTTDTVVVKSGHVLVITRRKSPGKGLLALPGGFLMKGKSIEFSAIKELKQETRIHVDAPILKREIKASAVFDYPDRDPRGRTITHAFLIDLGDGRLPEVRGGDDARRARWVPIREVLENPNKFYADHAHILYYFLMGQRWN